nr:integrase, catalytic region, zinc finger, CCHC-type, peptidase aspartic, catalytic [Tanacetum cinerariifolium]
EDKFLDKEVDLEAKIKDLENILFKRDQTVQTMHMLNPKPDSFYHPNQKMALGYPNPSYLKKAQLKQQSLYNGNMMLEEHNPPAVYDLEETLKLAQERREKMRFLKKEIKPDNYAKINHLSGIFVSQITKSKEELFLSNVSNMVTLSKMISIANEDLLDDTTPSVAQKFLNEVKSSLVTLQRVVKQKMTLEVHNWSSSAHKEEADESLDKQKSLEFEIERLLKASVSHDIMSIVQNSFVDVPSDLQTKLDQCKYDKISYDKSYNDMQQKVERLQAQLRHLKGKSSDTESALHTFDSLNQKLESKIVELEFQVVNYKRKISHLKTTYKNLFDSITSNRAHAELHDLIYENAQLRAWVFENTSESMKNTSGTSVTPHVDKPKLSDVTPHSKKLHASTPSHSFPQPREFNVVKHRNVAFRRNTCFIRDLDGVDLLKGNRSTNLYTINLYDMASASPICLMARATPTKSWLWHQRLSHLNFDTINDLAKNDLVSSSPKFKYAKEHLCPSCEQVKKQKSLTPTQTGFEFKAAAPSASYGFVCVGITHETSAAKTLQQNRVVERRNRTLVVAARTMLIFSHAPLFLWAEVIATACYTQNCSIIHQHFNKTPYELIQGKKPNISHLRVFWALCYPKNNREDISKLGAKGDIGFFIGYSANLVAYRVYNWRTKKIMEMMNVTFDELSAMAFEQNSSRPGLQSMTSGQFSSELELTYAPSTISPQRPSERDLDILFEQLHNEYLGGRPSEVPGAILAAPVLQNLQAPTAYMSFQESAPTPTNSSYTPVYSRNVDAPLPQHAQQQRNLTPSPTASVADNVLNAVFEGDLFVNSFAIPFNESVVSFTPYVDPSNMHTFYQLYPDDYQWTKDHPLEQVNQSPSGIFINQSKYVYEILKKYGLNTCDIIGTPMDIKEKLDLDQIGTLVDATKYHSMIGALMYLTSSRPDIIHAICVCARYQAHPTEKHLKENWRDLPKDTLIDRLEVLRYDIGKRSKVRTGIMSTETELTLEQTQQACPEPNIPLRANLGVLQKLSGTVMKEMYLNQDHLNDTCQKVQNHILASTTTTTLTLWISAQKRSTLLLSLSIMLRDTTKKVLRIGSLKDGAKKFVVITLKLLKKIDEVLRHREQLRRLEEHVKGRPKTVNPHTFLVVVATGAVVVEVMSDFVGVVKIVVVVEDVENIVWEIEFADEGVVEFYEDDDFGACDIPISTKKKYTTFITKHYVARYYKEGIEDRIPERWSKEVCCYHFEALKGTESSSGGLRSMLKEDLRLLIPILLFLVVLVQLVVVATGAVVVEVMSDFVGVVEIVVVVEDVENIVWVYEGVVEFYEDDDFGACDIPIRLLKQASFGC